MSREKFSEKEKDEIVKLYTTTDLSCTKIGKLKGVDCGVIIKILKKRGAYNPNKQKEIYEKRKELIVQYFNEGYTEKEIAQKIGCKSADTIYNHLRKVGVGEKERKERDRKRELARKKREEELGIFNSDRHLCKTCKYRVNGELSTFAQMKCDYLSLTGKMRNCDVDRCDKYEKGTRKKGKFNKSLYERLSPEERKMYSKKRKLDNYICKSDIDCGITPRFSAYEC